MKIATPPAGRTAIRIAIQGEAGSFSEEAARRLQPGCSIVPCARSAEVFDRLERGSVAAAVIPIENSLAGSVTEHFDLLLARKVFIEREYRLRIVHNLIAARGVKRTDLRRAFSHPVALEQCRDFFAKNSKIQPLPFYDTAGSVKHVIESSLRDAAGIAGRQAAKVYHGHILAAGIEDDKRNFTRFFLLRKTRRILPGANKTSIAFSVKNVAGALFKALAVFALRDISLTKIESRPRRGRPWEYVFYVDFLRGDDESARNALRHLGEVADLVKVLGIYPAA
ncbi:MAG TPA: prephenate dehydratase domain-containing protein [Terriglobales bacterium]|jgi:prephenate dehydratase|nr:prephenate dehydratase domain-containing protein [Terriglobales bacterium]